MSLSFNAIRAKSGSIRRLAVVLASTAILGVGSATATAATLYSWSFSTVDDEVFATGTLITDVPADGPGGARINSVTGSYPSLLGYLDQGTILGLLPTGTLYEAGAFATDNRLLSTTGTEMLDGGFGFTLGHFHLDGEPHAYYRVFIGDLSYTDSLQDLWFADETSPTATRRSQGIFRIAEAGTEPPSPVPAPGTLSLLIVGLAGLAFTRRQTRVPAARRVVKL